MPTTIRRPVIKTFSCSCGFRRDWNDDEKGDHVIDHPLWGVVTTREAAYQDIRIHDCDEYARAIARARTIFGTPRDYPSLLPQDTAPVG